MSKYDHIEDAWVKEALEEYKDLIIGLVEKEMSGVRIHEELRKDGLKISYPSVARYVETIPIGNEIA